MRNPQKKLWLASCLVVLIWVGCSKPPHQEQADEAVDPDDLTLIALKIKQGDSHKQVLELLGKPTWASIPGDPGDYGVNDPKTGLILYWRNPGLAVVEVQFDTDLRVRWDGGVPLNAASYTHMFEPGPNYDCAKPDRAELCR